MKTTQTQSKPSTPIQLPQLTFDVVEQLVLAIQNRDERALEFLITDEMKSDTLKDKKGFIEGFISYCNTLQKKHVAIYVHTTKGGCNSSYCNPGKTGFSVSVHAVIDNKQLWHFNLITEVTPYNQVEVWKCFDFKINRCEV
jgi:hypothetical protein